MFKVKILLRVCCVYFYVHRGYVLHFIISKANKTVHCSCIICVAQTLFYAINEYWILDVDDFKVIFVVHAFIQIAKLTSFLDNVTHLLFKIWMKNNFHRHLLHIYHHYVVVVSLSFCIDAF